MYIEHGVLGAHGVLVCGLLMLCSPKSALWDLIPSSLSSPLSHFLSCSSSGSSTSCCGPGTAGSCCGRRRGCGRPRPATARPSRALSTSSSARGPSQPGDPARPPGPRAGRQPGDGVSLSKGLEPPGVRMLKGDTEPRGSGLLSGALCVTPRGPCLYGAHKVLGTSSGSGLLVSALVWRCAHPWVSWSISG